MASMSTASLESIKMCSIACQIAITMYDFQRISWDFLKKMCSAPPRHQRACRISIIMHVNSDQSQSTNLKNNDTNNHVAQLRLGHTLGVGERGEHVNKLSQKSLGVLGASNHTESVSLLNRYCPFNHAACLDPGSRFLLPPPSSTWLATQAGFQQASTECLTKS